MNDKAALLNQLKIDRAPEPDREAGVGRWIVIGLIVAALIAAVAWWLMRPDGIAVQVARVESAGGASGAPASTLDASGYVVARRMATVSSEITGKVIEVLIEEGQRVAAGQIVGRLDDTNIRASFDQAQAQLALARASEQQVRVQLDNAQRDYERRQQLLARNFVSQADVDNARTTLDNLKAQLVTAQRNSEVASRTVNVSQKNLDDTVVRAPFAGVITVKAAQTGEIISPLSAGGGFTRTGIGTIVDMESLEVEVDVNESFINRVSPAQPALIKLNAYPDWEIPAEVIAIIPTADRAKATVKVRVGFKQKGDPRVLPDMGARVAFLSAAPSAGAVAAPAGVRVPARAVQVSGDTGVAWVVRDDKLERRAVKLGPSQGETLTVLAGLSAGERVAIGDSSTFADGQTVIVKP